MLNNHFQGFQLCVSNRRSRGRLCLPPRHAGQEPALAVFEPLGHNVPSHRSQSLLTCHRDPADSFRHEDECDTSTGQVADPREYLQHSEGIGPALPSSSEHHPAGRLATHGGHESEDSSYSYTGRKCIVLVTAPTSHSCMSVEYPVRAKSELQAEFPARRMKMTICPSRGQ